MRIPPDHDGARDPLDLLGVWADHLERRAGGCPGGGADWPLWPPPEAIRPARPRDGDAAGEIRLWRSMRDGLRGEAALRDAGIDPAGTGPLWPSGDWSAIEVWTEAELCGMHALSRMADDPLVASRLRSLLLWHLEHTQPDNATNRPWALHAFLLHAAAAAADGDADADASRGAARCYAETLLHNAEAQGLEDPASRWILADAARAIRARSRSANAR
jgi:hypothetical protein